jgi:hypothetical protein
VKLNKALYGLVESAKLWFEHLKRCLLLNNFESLNSDECVFKSQNGCRIALHVDDLFISAPNETILEGVAAFLKENFKNITVNTGRVLSYLGMEMNFSVANEVTFSQTGYVSDLIEHCNIRGTACTPYTSKLFVINEDSSPEQRLRTEPS